MTAIDRCEIFIATFIAPFDENRLKPNRGEGLSLSRHLLISRFAMKTVKVSSDLRIRRHFRNHWIPLFSLAKLQTTPTEVV